MSTTLALTLAFSGIQAGEARPLNDIMLFASRDLGKKLLSSEDAYTAKWSQFDIHSRLHNDYGSRKALLAFAANQAMEWTEEEMHRIKGVLLRIDSIIVANNFYFPLPDSVYLIKSSLLEEGGAGGYTRENFIVLRQDLVGRDNNMLERIILHEIFHVLTRNDPGYRERFYEIIGFTVSNPVAYPESIAEMRITNPDAHLTDSYIRLSTMDSIAFDAVMILYSERPYTSGLFFQYMTIGFLEVSGPHGEKDAVLQDGRPVIRKVDEVTGFFEQVGRNTQYIIDPEEILADNFAMAFKEIPPELPDPHVVNSIRMVLTDGR